MDNENYVFISIIANFKLVKRLTNDLQMIIDVLKGFNISQTSLLLFVDSSFRNALG